MYILSIETTGKYGSAALIDGDGRISSKSSHEEMNHLKDIMLLADEGLKTEGIGTNSIDAVAASIGPGSFTGIRIGVSSARGIAEMLNIPCISISSLEGMAALADAHVGEEVRFFAPIINARRGQLYGALFERDEFLEEIDKIDSEEKQIIFVGDGIDAYEDKIREAGLYRLADEEWRYQDASSVAELALQKYNSNNTITYDYLLPNYMRKSEAEMRLESGTLSSKIGKLR